MKGRIDILDGNQSAAWGARLARVKSVPCFPITPQTEMIEVLSEWVANDEVEMQFNPLDSEHSVLSAALGSEMTGARTFTASSSQGIMLMHEVLHIVSGTRMPVVMVNVSRGLSAPITLWSDHNDFLGMRDTGWLMMACETNQEVLDSVIIGYMVGEDRRIRLPVLINMDGFIHSYTRTEVEVPSQVTVDKFLPPLRLDTVLDVKKPMSLGIPVLSEYMYFKSQVHKAQLDAKKVFLEAFSKWKTLTGRGYGLLESYRMKDADFAFVIMGANSTIAKAAVDSLRRKGKRAGLVKIFVYRPFPREELSKALSGVGKIAVMDQNLSPGSGGILYPEVKSALSGSKNIISSFIFSLGGKPVSEKDFAEVYNTVISSEEEKRIWLL